MFPDRNFFQVLFLLTESVRFESYRVFCYFSIMKKHAVIKAFVLGFAVFAIFFGAGNLIFPPYLGLESGGSWFSGFLAFSLVDIGMAIATVIAIIRSGGDTTAIFSRLGKKPAVILAGIAIICVGPLIAIPRTCATTFDMSITHLLPGFGMIPFTAVFFALTCVLSLKPSSIVDIIGKFLTPALLISLLILIVKNLIVPIGTVKAGIGAAAVKEGFMQGYQTLDVLAAVSITSVIVASLKDQGHTPGRAMTKQAVISCLIAAAGLFITYAGLCYLGASASSLYTTSDYSQTELIAVLSQHVLGYAGYAILAVMVLFACLTTAIGLTSASANYLTDVTKGRISYKIWVVIICVFDAVIANMGTVAIINTAAPILNLIYPLVLTQIILTYFGKYVKSNAVFRGAALGALLCSVLSLLDEKLIGTGFMKQMPLASIGLEWVLFAVAGMLIGLAVAKVKK